MTSWWDIKPGISVGEILTIGSGLVVFVVSAAYAVRGWWMRQKPFTLRVLIDPFDVPPEIESKRRNTNYVMLAMGEQTIEFQCLPRIPWEATYLDLRFVRPRFPWLPNWLWLPQQW